MDDSRLVSLGRMFWRCVRAKLLPVHIEHHTRIVTPEPDGLCRNPIFVIGTHRSGTTLLRRILDSHRNIACPPESHYLRHLFRLLEDERAMLGLSQMGYSEADVLKQLRRSVVQFHELYRRAKGKPRWADKTPEYALHLPALHRMFGTEAQLLFLFRHPLDCAYSLWFRGWRVGENRDADLFVNTCRHVLDSGMAQLQFLAHNPGVGHTLCYEDLVHSPESILRSVCNYLGEPWDSQMLRQEEAPHDYGDEDPVVRVTRGFRPSHGNWRGWSSGQIRQAEGILQPLMTALGYSCEVIGERPAALPLSRAA